MPGTHILSIINNNLEKTTIKATDSMLYVKDVQTGDTILTMEKNNNPVKSLVFNPDKIMIASESTNSILYIKDIQTGDIIVTLEGRNGPLR
jgi:WD40 repeat protein